MTHFFVEVVMSHSPQVQIYSYQFRNVCHEIRSLWLELDYYFIQRTILSLFVTKQNILQMSELEKRKNIIPRLHFICHFQFKSQLNILYRSLKIKLLETGLCICFLSYISRNTFVNTQFAYFVERKRYTRMYFVTVRLLFAHYLL